METNFTEKSGRFFERGYTIGYFSNNRKIDFCFFNKSQKTASLPRMSKTKGKKVISDKITSFEKPHECEIVKGVIQVS